LLFVSFFVPTKRILLPDFMSSIQPTQGCMMSHLSERKARLYARQFGVEGNTLKWLFSRKSQIPRRYKGRCEDSAPGLFALQRGIHGSTSAPSIPFARDAFGFTPAKPFFLGESVFESPVLPAHGAADLKDKDLA
jgi:hypothetical protein